VIITDNKIPVSKEDHSKNVTELQNYLRTIAYNGGNIPIIIADGIYGDSTKQAVSAFQRENALPVTGQVNKSTWDKIYLDYSDIRDNYITQECITAFPSIDTIISENDSGGVILILQAMINTLAASYINIPQVGINGIYDTTTAEAIKELQRVFGIEDNGLVDLRTWNMLVRTFNADNEYTYGL